MKLSPDFDPKKGCIVLNLECQLLAKYFDVFETCFNNIPNSDRLNLERKGDCSVNISLPTIEGGLPDKLTGENSLGDMGIKSFAVETNDMNNIKSAINEFLNQSLSKALKTTEFIPLEGYSWDSMREDIREAIKHKRSFCVIKDYDEYLRMQKDNKYVFHQYMLEYGSEEYSDAAIMIFLDEQKKMKEIYDQQLELVDWC